MIKAWAAKGPKQKLEPFEYDPGPLGAEEVEIAVESCGICHSDLSVFNNEWGISQYPAVPGHELIGHVVAMGPQVKGVEVGQAVGVGWGARSCMHCHQCLCGDQNLCAENLPTIVGHYGGFGERLRVQWPWAIPLPDGLDTANTGPLLCGGTTVFIIAQRSNASSPNRLFVFIVDPQSWFRCKSAGALLGRPLSFAESNRSDAPRVGT
jgi:uncharacterized zinc-type alcohol dehydrogenase-like protein